MKKILITGALGQIGAELTVYLRERYGNDNVIASGLEESKEPSVRDVGHYHLVDVTDGDQIAEVVRQHDVDTIYHLAALLSAKAEDKPQAAWSVNIGGTYNVLEVARQYGCAVFTPSSIGAFGPSTPRRGTPQDTIQRPTSMYGVTKVAGELLCDYYHQRFDVDTRGVRYPGIISYNTLPGGGTTDYAVDIYYEAIKKKRFTCYLKADTALDMMYMPDALKAAVQVMEADSRRLKHRNAFNVTAMSLTPEKIATAIRRRIPEFTVDYEIDSVRQAIADSWPEHMDDSAAREEWDWSPEYDLSSMTEDMLDKLAGKLAPGGKKSLTK